MLSGSFRLESIPDISNLNTMNITNMSDILFYGCSSLTTLPDISKWNTKNIKDMSEKFVKCESII